MNPAKYILLALVRAYRWVISPAKIFFFGPGARCRFTPTCSEYALQAVESHGALAGSWLAAKRVCRCHPWGGFGYDPVPARERQVESHSVEIGGGASVPHLK